MPEGQDFESYVLARQRSLLRSAYLLTGDVHGAEDLVQAALLKAWSRWSRVADMDDPDAYVRKVLVNTFFTWRRRRWHQEMPTAQVPQTVVDDPTEPVAEELWVWSRLQVLTPRQRAVVVLRFYEDLSQEQVAGLLGCGVGAVKTHCSRALEKLRRPAPVLREVP